MSDLFEGEDFGIDTANLTVDQPYLRLDEHYRCCLECAASEKYCARAQALKQEVFNIVNKKAT